jgi:sRNA-binding regulator protein Hfq
MKMRRLLFSLLGGIILMAATTQADTLHLKNGSVLKGKVTSFADDQFIVLLDTGSGRYVSRAMVYMGDVARIEFDSAAGAGDAGVSPTTDSPAPSRTVQADSPSASASESPRTSSAADQPKREPDQPKRDPEQPKREPDSQPTSSSAQPSSSQTREPETALPDRPSVTTNPPPTSPDPAPDQEKPRKFTGPVRTATIDVAGKRDWTSTGLIVKRGDHIRVTATGTVTLDPASGRSTGPEGSPDIPDSKKLMPDQPTGALIGVIGADNDDFIFIGRSAEFTATRDGLLFVSVNEGNLADNTGSYKAVIELQAARR